MHATRVAGAGIHRRALNQLPIRPPLRSAPLLTRLYMRPDPQWEREKVAADRSKQQRAETPDFFPPPPRPRELF
jgi:hypothetical protein